MGSRRALTFKIATEDHEFEQVHRLNYRTFVKEIPQHPGNTEGLLVDKFHGRNTYVICLDEGNLVGMVSFAGPPYSLEGKLPDLEAHLPAGRRICELRLLSVEPSRRHGTILWGLVECLARYLPTLGYDAVIISGIVSQVKLYENLGFTPFGPQVGDDGARFQPMILTREAWEARVRTLARQPAGWSQGPEPLSLLPGPVNIAREVRDALASPPVSHRARVFVADFQLVRHLLKRMVNARHVQVLVGSGTVANDAVAAQLSLRPGRGLVLASGEFGERLIDHARRFRLDFDALHMPWGEAFDFDRIRERMDQIPDLDWLWCTHCETSTGVLHDLDRLRAVCDERGARLALDCISSVATVPVDLSGVYLASGASGKALGSFAGLGLVFHDHPIEPRPDRVPRYLDLALYATENGSPFTVPSNLVHALQAALRRFQTPGVFEEIAELSAWVRSELRKIGCELVAPDEVASPAVVTIALPESMNSEWLGNRLEERGFVLSYESIYLLRRNWIQICLMGPLTREGIEPLFGLLQKYLPDRHRRRSPSPDPQMSRPGGS